VEFSHLPARPPQRRRVLLDPRAQSRPGRGSRGAAANPGRQSAAAADWLITSATGTQKKLLGIAVEATRTAARPSTIVLLYGPPGLGQNHHGPWCREGELGVRLAASPGAGPLEAPPRHRRPADQPCSPTSCCFIDEIHRLNRRLGRGSCSIRPWRTTALIFNRLAAAAPPAPLGASCGAVHPGWEPPTRAGSLELTGCVNRFGLDSSGGVFYGLADLRRS